MTDKEIGNLKDPVLDDIIDDKKKCGIFPRKKSIIIISVVFIIVLISVCLIFIIIGLGTKNFEVLKLDKDFIKPKSKLNAEFELVRMKNGMTGLLISRPHTNLFHIEFEVEYGSIIDLVPGLAHLLEHMIFGGSQKYKNNAVVKKFGGLRGFTYNAGTASIFQFYYATIINNFLSEEITKVYLDAFRHPSYDPNDIKKEVQAINSEFYLGYRDYEHLLEDIIKLMGNKNTSFYGFSCGNNITLSPNKNEELSKQLKAFHMVANRPENIFFILFSNLTIKQSEDFIKNNDIKFNYRMKDFSDKEVDLYKKQIEENIKKLKTTEIFDDNLYKHGIIFKSSVNQNILEIFFHLGKIDHKDLKFFLFDYYEYLFRSKSLMDILKKNGFITSMNKINVKSFLRMENNNVLALRLDLTENGVENLDDVLLIIYKYINLIKEEGYKEKYFNNFMLLKNNQMTINFNKNNLFPPLQLGMKFLDMILSYRLFGEDQILTGKAPPHPIEEEKLKNYLNNIKYEKSFFTLNTNLTNYTKIFSSTEKKLIDYYNLNITLGDISEEFEENVNSKEKYKDLEMREINPYLSKLNDIVTPCYKKKENDCRKLNEFDINEDDEYEGVFYKNDQGKYISFYQIDKSSENHLVNVYIKINFEPNKILALLSPILVNYLSSRLNDLNEIETTSLMALDDKHMSFTISSFSDTVEIILSDLINIIQEEPQETEFNYTMESIKLKENVTNDDLITYTAKIMNKFVKKGETEPTPGNVISVDFNDRPFQALLLIHDIIINTTNKITLKATGNVDENLIKNLHDILKDGFPIKDNRDLNILNISNFAEQEVLSEFIIDYYQKSDLPGYIDNAILVVYLFNNPRKYGRYAKILEGCLNDISMVKLRFEKSNAYTPLVQADAGKIILFEQGRFKNVTEMEDDINDVINGMINGTFECESYKDIIKSYQEEIDYDKYEVSPQELFYQYILPDEMEETADKVGNDGTASHITLNPNIRRKRKKKPLPSTFKEFIEIISPIFINPKRYTALIIRKDDDTTDINKLMEYRRNNLKYKPNKDVLILHTDKIDYLKNITINPY